MKKYIFLFLTTAILAFGISFFSQFYRNYHLNNVLEKTGYEEAKTRIPTFTTDIKTKRSITHVISYLPSSILSREQFHDAAAQKTIDYVEGIADKEAIYVFRPFISMSDEIGVKQVPRGSAFRENYVFMIPRDFPFPQNLIKKGLGSPTIYNSDRPDKTFFWTSFDDRGSVSILHFAESNTWRQGLPSKSNQFLSPIQQLNAGFNIEIWKRTVEYRLIPTKNKLVNNDNVLFYMSEIMWNTFGQLVLAKQEEVPTALMQWRLNETSFAKVKDLKYYPFDDKAKAIYDAAPNDRIIK